MNVRPSTIFTFCRTEKAMGVTPRTVTLTSVWSPVLFGSEAMVTISGDASGCPSPSRFTRASTMIMLALSRLKPELISEFDPR